LQTICPGWLWTAFFLISASWVARITGMSHWHPALSLLNVLQTALENHWGQQSASE
jgi:hypothetical protein